MKFVVDRYGGLVGMESIPQNCRVGEEKNNPLWYKDSVSVSMTITLLFFQSHLSWAMVDNWQIIFWYVFKKTSA